MLSGSKKNKVRKAKTRPDKQNIYIAAALIIATTINIIYSIPETAAMPPPVNNHDSSNTLQDENTCSASTVSCSQTHNS
ncbi:hypothetical protein [Pseudoalteromonas undina]|uniref:Uncharacterized protein n=1 Tax=Pseudoalteromonas undina TaxID=43660 RepID=A0ACC6R325_9GAMM